MTRATFEQLLSGEVNTRSLINEALEPEPPTPLDLARMRWRTARVVEGEKEDD
jgi:hypothetical protein